MTRLLLAPGTPIATAAWRLSRLDDLIPIAQATGSAPPSAVVTAGGSAHTKGSWAELSASTPEADGLEVLIMENTHFNGGNTGLLLDIGIGAGGSEDVKIANIQVGGRTGLGNRVSVGRFPLRIPAGSRLAARSQSITALDTCQTGYRFFKSATGAASPPKLVTMGANVANSFGVSASVSSNDVKGAWSEIIASTVMPFRGLIVGMGSQDAAMQAGLVLVDVAVGPAGGEQVILADLGALSYNTSEQFELLDPGVWPVRIPAGSRLAVRYSCATTTVSPLDFTLIGVP